ncbi:nitrous oxide-stimulated promoter family protein [Campylobacter pinnipediorum]|uniref:nitrous oxide-stimulated promoter family protein n=1 Tax=Campylobacter pinnipediorum TaxID=1965231 RepID=UPI0009952360|nr:nitrous oxide-stimulated promoter family protein [Campylobacter pinnipediorum]AQW82546.1 putative nitrous oxide-regulated protein [Campylobacter pinnipediorum subsp. pinnipediorum]
MTKDKFKSEIQTVTKFIQLYCDDKHKDNKKTQRSISVDFNGEDNVLNMDVYLCDECMQITNYAYERLKRCPHTEKPRCHKCPHPCYELPIWKQMAKIMRYSGMKLGLNKIKRLIFRD